MNVHQKEKTIPYGLIPVAGLTTKLGQLSCQIPKGDVLLSDEDLDRVG